MRTISVCLFIASLAIASLQGCATRLEIGSPPRIDRLAQLTPHVSKVNDVLFLLGEPRGYGASHLDPTLPRERVWLYEYNVSEGKSIQITMLLVFFSKETYTGYMWFADATNLKEHRGDRKQ